MSELAALLSPDASERQRASTALIEAEFLAAGFPLAVAAGAVVNAYAESGLNPSSRKGTMIGLFQLEQNGGLGHGMTDEQLLDGRTNTRRFIQVMKGSWGQPIRDAIAAGERRPHVFARLIAVHVERPSHAEERGLHREGLTAVVFPGLVQQEDVLGGAVADGLAGISPAQVEAAELIEARLIAAGLPAEVTAAAIVNAYAESHLDPAKVRREKNGTFSVGLFQLNDRGEGAGMTINERKDPRANIDRILAAYRHGRGRRIEAAYAQGERDVGELARLWCLDLERPADAELRSVERRGLAYRLLPGWQTLLPVAEVQPKDTGTAPTADAGGGRASSGLALVFLGVCGALGIGIRRATR